MQKALVALGAVAAAAVLVIPTALFASPAQQNDDEILSAAVPYGDLNLTSPRDVSALARRIDFAAHSVCGRPYAFEMFVSPERRSCISDAVASAQPAFDAAVSAAQSGTVTISYGASLIVSAPRP